MEMFGVFIMVMVAQVHISVIDFVPVKWMWFTLCKIFLDNIDLKKEKERGLRPPQIILQLVQQMKIRILFCHFYKGETGLKLVSVPVQNNIFRNSQKVGAAQVSTSE